MTADNGWTPLPAHVTPAEFQALQRRVRADKRALFAEAGIRFRSVNGRVMLRADPQRLIYSAPLQNSDGRLRQDASRRLHANTFGSGVRPSANAMLSIDDVVDHPPALARMRVGLLTEPDPLIVVRGHLSTQPGSRFIRVGADPRFMIHNMCWNLIHDLIRGIPADQIAIGSQRPDNSLLHGLVESNPAHIVCAGLMARNQPRVAVFTTGDGADLVLIPEGAFIRPRDNFTGHPVGIGRPNLGGPGGPIYRTDVKVLPSQHGVQLLEEAVAHGNTLFNTLTDPRHFVDANGDFDMGEQIITWANVRFAFDAINVMAERWNVGDFLWSALRALGILQGLWEGPRQGSVPLRRLLDPRNIRAHALTALTDPIDTLYYSGLVDNYERELRAAFPSQSLDECLASVEEVRHLVHGTGGQGRRARDARVRVLSSLSEHGPNLQLIGDMAVLWWEAVLANPARLAVPGGPDWVRQPSTTTPRT